MMTSAGRFSTSRSGSRYWACSAVSPGIPALVICQPVFSASRVGQSCPASAPEWERFLRAWGTIAYHEILLVAALAAIWLHTGEAANPVGYWTFALLFAARISAKLNLFLGVPRIHTDLLPGALAHLPSHFRTARLNWLFPISITGLTFAVACWIERLNDATDPGRITAFALLAAITALALVEHWLMVLPLPDEKLWRWMLPAPDPKTDTLRPEDAHGL